MNNGNATAEGSGLLCVSMASLRRRSRRSQSMVCARSNMSGRQLQFDRRECQALCDTWDSVLDRQEFGAGIVMQVLTDKPALKRIFNFSVHDENLRTSETFKKHAANFAMFLHVALTRLLAGECEALVELATHVGQAHATFRGVSFDAEYWLTFKNAVLTQLDPHFSKVRLTSSTFARDVWNRFLMFIIMEMKTAFNQHTVRRLSSSDLRETIRCHLVNDYQDCDDEFIRSNGSDRRISLPEKFERSTTCPMPRRHIPPMNQPLLFGTDCQQLPSRGNDIVKSEDNLSIGNEVLLLKDRKISGGFIRTLVTRFSSNRRHK